MMNPFHESATVVLVHGAWADGSSWKEVICRLQRQGIHVIAAPIPLTSLKDDVAALRRVLERTEGPLVLAAHAYAGAVISVPHEERIKGLAYVAALTPDEGETVAEVFYREEPHRTAPKLSPEADGFIWMPEEGFANAFAQNASSDVVGILAAVQRPIALPCINEPVPAPSWKTKPSWYLLAEEDRMISSNTQRFMAKRMRAKIRSAPVDHAPLLTSPELVVDLILQAARAVLS